MVENPQNRGYVTRYKEKRKGKEVLIFSTTLGQFLPQGFKTGYKFSNSCQCQSYNNGNGEVIAMISELKRSNDHFDRASKNVLCASNIIVSFSSKEQQFRILKNELIDLKVTRNF